MICIGTRVHSNQGSFYPDIDHLMNWCKRTLRYADKVLIATDQFLFDQLDRAFLPLGNQVQLLLVSPWHGFTMALNALLAEATILGAEKILLQSVEVDSSAADFSTLHRHFDDSTLVVGAKLTKEHGVKSGVQEINALNSPWNTLALWDLKKLNLTGFIGISNGLVDNIPGGMEEVVTISLLQHLQPNEMTSKLVTLPEVQWQIAWQDPKRKTDHESKMASKLTRAEMQLQYLNHPRGLVEVI